MAGPQEVGEQRAGGNSLFFPMKHFLLALILASSFAVPASAADGTKLTITQTALHTTDTIPRGARRIPMLSLQLKASCSGPVLVKSITIHHTGMGATNDISQVTLMEGVNRESRSAVFQMPSATATIQTPTLRIDACKTRLMTIAMDLSADAAIGAEHRLSILSAQDIQTDSQVVLAEPMNQGSSAPSAITPSSIGSVTYTSLPSSSINVLFGKNRTLLRFSLKASAEAKQSIQAITFVNKGSARDTDIKHVGIWSTDAKLLSDEVESLTNDSVRIPFSKPLILQKNQTRIFTLRADVTASKRRTLKLVIEEESDIEAHAEAGRKTGK